jgi:hypothetical protein
VLNLFETHPIELYHLTIVTADGRRERLGTTGNHPFYEASERRFVPARELRPGCRVVTVTGAIAEVEAVEVHTAAAGESFTTYNIEVEEDHTYHVGELGTWVHNESAERCLELAREAANGSEEAVEELRRIFSKAPKLRRSIDGQLREIVDSDLLRRIDAPRGIPSVRGGEFQSWFNKLTPDELQKIWTDPALRKQIEQRLRSPGGFHEWLPVSRAPIFKRWGITADQIHQLRTATKDVVFKSGRHGGDLSGLAHQQLFKLIDESPDFATYIQKLRKWADDNLVGGAGALPEGLRP